MKIHRFMVVSICLLVGCAVVGDLALARAQDEKPPAEESKKDAEKEKDEEKGEEKKPDADKEKAKDADQKPPAERPFDESVKVTATRVETELMKTPVAVTAIDQEELDRQGVQDITGIADMVPNMDVSIINGQSTPIIALRGIRSTNETELGDPAVGVHLDGIYTPRMQGALGLMFDNERVEVLRGPQGTLFGRNSTVGSINIISAKPKTDAYAGRVWFQYGNYDTAEMQVMVNVPVNDKFAFRFAGRGHKRDSYLDGYWDPNQFDQRHIADLVEGAPVIAPGSFDECTSPECYVRTQHSNWWIDSIGGDIRALVPADDDDFYMNAEESAYRFSALWKPTKNISTNLYYQRFHSDSAGGVDLVNCEQLRGRPTYDEDGIANGTNDCSDMFPRDDTYQAVVNVPGRLLLDIEYVRGNFTWDINDDLRFVYLGGLEHQQRESAQDMEQALNAWDGAMFFLPGTGSRSWMHEIQLQSYGAKKFNWIAGANLFHEKTSTIGFYDNPINDKSFWLQPDRASDSWAVFGQGTYSLTDKWHLTLGMRYSDETKEDKNGRTYACNNANGCAPGGVNGRDELNALPEDYFEDPAVYPEFSANDNKGSWTHTDWRLGVDYEMNPNTLLYASLATGFKAGGIGDVFHEINPRTLEEINVRTAYGPEEVLTFELGAKQRLAKGKLDLRGTYFYMDYDDMQYASVAAIAFTERWEALRDSSGQIILDEDGYPVFDWVTAPIVAYFTQNVPGAEIQGIELEYDWRPWRGGRINGYASWLDTEITDDWVTKWSYDPVSYFGLNYEDSIDPNNPALEANLKGNELAVAPPYTLRMTVDHAFSMPQKKMVIKPWLTATWEDDAYMTIWNVDKHTDDMEFVIFDEDIHYTDDKREAWTMVHAGVQFYRGDWSWELYGYNLNDEVVQYWSSAAEQVNKGSFSMPRTYGFRVAYQFSKARAR